MPDLAAAAPYTWDDFLALDEDDLRELIDGELVEVEVPTWKHERIVARLCQLLGAWADVAGGGVVLGSGYKVRISERRGVMPDVQFYRAGNEAVRDQDTGLARGRPDLVVEIISPSSRRYDRVTKLRWYAEIAVPEYWLIDAEAQTLERLLLRGGTYEIAGSFAEGETFRPSTVPELDVALGRLWGE